MPAKSQAQDPPQEFVKVNKWDGTAVKNSLDDAVKDILVGGKLPYEEDHGLMNGRLFICGIAVAVAMFALLWDYLHPFPTSKPVLVGCVLMYFLLMSVLTVYTTYTEKGIFVVAMQKDPAGLDPPNRWEASSNMKKFDDMYDLSLNFTDGKNGTKRDASFSKSCAEFFDENGQMCTDLIEKAVLNLHKSLADKQD